MVKYQDTRTILFRGTSNFSKELQVREAGLTEVRNSRWNYRYEDHEPISSTEVSM